MKQVVLNGLSLIAAQTGHRTMAEFDDKVDVIFSQTKKTFTNDVKKLLPDDVLTESLVGRMFEAREGYQTLRISE